MARLTTHVLDTARGAPAGGISIEVHRIDGTGRRLVASAMTDRDGRTPAPLMADESLEPGVYELTFHVADYLAGTGAGLTDPPFIGDVIIRVGLADARATTTCRCSSLRMATRLIVDPELLAYGREVIRECRAIAALSEEPGATTRTFLSPPMQEVHQRLRDWMTRLGMRVHVDAAGNIRGMRAAQTADAPTLFIGSHLDSVPRAGAFDGVLGVVMGMTLVEILGSMPLPFSIEVIGFSEEEGVRFGVPFIGSRAFAGLLDDALLEREDSEGISVRGAIRQFGLDPIVIDRAVWRGPSIGYLEFHIEQGPVLEGLGAPVGIVDAIAGQTRGDMRFDGRAAHAGTTPMNNRRDAVAAAAAWIIEVEDHARETPGLVATVGRVDAQPGATNIVAGQCTCSLDVRHADDGRRLAKVATLVAAAERIAAARGLSASWHPRLDQPAVAMDAHLVGLLESAIERTGLAPHHITSGAGHDAMIVASSMPAAMLFLRSPGGVSHHPDEAVLVEDVAEGLRVGRALVLALAERHG